MLSATYEVSFLSRSYFLFSRDSAEAEQMSQILIMISSALWMKMNACVIESEEKENDQLRISLPFSYTQRISFLFLRLGFAYLFEIERRRRKS